MADKTNRQLAYETAAAKAVLALRSADMVKRCQMLELPFDDKNIRLKILGTNLAVSADYFNVINPETGKPCRQVDRILALHYLMSEIHVEEKGELISFSDLTGGQFYLEPFRSRTVVPLQKNIGNDIELLRERLGRYEWESVKYGDLGARIHAIGKIYITLVYRAGDEEFPPAAELLFDAIIKKVFSTDDVSALAGRLCMGLL